MGVQVDSTTKKVLIDSVSKKVLCCINFCAVVAYNPTSISATYTFNYTRTDAGNGCTVNFDGSGSFSGPLTSFSESAFGSPDGTIACTGCTDPGHDFSTTFTPQFQYLGYCNIDDPPDEFDGWWIRLNLGGLGSPCMDGVAVFNTTSLFDPAGVQYAGPGTGKGSFSADLTLDDGGAGGSGACHIDYTLT